MIRVVLTFAIIYLAGETWGTWGVLVGSVVAGACCWGRK